MKTLVSLIEEFVKFFPNKKISDWFNIDKTTIKNFSFISFCKKNFKITNRRKSLDQLIHILLYFEFIKKKKKIFLQNFYFIQICSLHNFFSNNISFLINLINKKRICSHKILNEPFKKLFYAIMINKKKKELNTTIPFWKNQNFNFLIIEIFNLSFQEIVTKIFAQKIDISYYFKKYRLNILKQRFHCFFSFLYTKKFLFNEKILSIYNSVYSSFCWKFIWDIKQALTPKNLKIILESVACCSYYNNAFQNYEIFGLITLLKKYLRRKKVKTQFLIDKSNDNDYSYLDNNNFVKNCVCNKIFQLQLKKIRLKFYTDFKTNPFSSLI
jgi:hypothetical protein